jgi:hypothetical protein
MGPGRWRCEIPLEVSGFQGLLKVRVKIQEGSDRCWAGVEVPPPSPAKTQRIALRLGPRRLSGHLVRFPGITHLVLDPGSCPLVDAPSHFPLVLDAARELAGCHEGAFGMVWHERLGQGRIRMHPIVCLTTDPPQFFYEQSCGSGAAALGMALAEGRGVEGAYAYHLIPPSGVPIQATGTRSHRTRKCRDLHVQGPVFIRGPVKPVGTP